jgi:hypothetical protein
VLIDGGSGLNVLFTKTLKKMKLDITHMLSKSNTPFYGIVPGNAAIPLGSVVLPVTFGASRDNYRTEYIMFEVVDFETSYRAILGRPAIAKFEADRVLDFLDELVHRYGLPHRIITDLESNFNNHPFWEYCENSGIDVRYVSVAHPRANGQVERANGMVLDALKKRLHDAANSKGGKWIKELPNALWGLRTQPSKPTGQSSYFLVYGSEAILPADVIWNSPAVEHYDKGVSEDS